ncbi:hypothetical protein HDZ31DRAFT_85814 [Schizophyllum fasciatum]
MVLTEKYCDEYTCDLTGDTYNLSCCRLVPIDAAQGDERQVARQEWIYGTPLGGLPPYLKSRANCVVCIGESILVSTFKTYTRYVYIAVTDAAHRLQAQLGLQPQTNEDLSGILPGDNEPCQEGTDLYPVVECHAHPYTIAVFANKMLWIHNTTVTEQWHALNGNITNSWVFRRTNPSTSFIDAPRYDADDCEPDPLAILGESSITEGDPRKLIADWACNKIDPNAPPPEEKPIRIEYKVRRSERIRRTACPYDRPLFPTRS